MSMVPDKWGDPLKPANAFWGLFSVTAFFGTWFWAGNIWPAVAVIAVCWFIPNMLKGN